MPYQAFTAAPRVHYGALLMPIEHILNTIFNAKTVDREVLSPRTFHNRGCVPLATQRRLRRQQSRSTFPIIKVLSRASHQRVSPLKSLRPRTYNVRVGKTFSDPNLIRH